MNSFVEHLYRFECVILLYHYFLFTRFYHVITKKILVAGMESLRDAYLLNFLI